MMRGIVGFVALLIGVWYLRDRQRRARLREGLRDSLPTRRDEPGSARGSSVNEMASRVQATVGEVRSNMPETAPHVADLATSAGQTLVQQVQERANAARQSASNAAATQSTGASTDGEQLAVQPTTDQSRASRETSEEARAETSIPTASAAALEVRGDGPGSATSEENATPTASAGETADATPGAEQPSGFIGNVNSRVYHPSTSHNLPAEENRIAFATEEEALAAGFRPAEGEGLAGEAGGVP
jgi:hypothetical protein